MRERYSHFRSLFQLQDTMNSKLVWLIWFKKITVSYLFLQCLDTVCPRSSDPFYVVTYCIKWVTTSWTYSMTLAVQCIYRVWFMCKTIWLILCICEGLRIRVFWSNRIRFLDPLCHCLVHILLSECSTIKIWTRLFGHNVREAANKFV